MKKFNLKTIKKWKTTGGEERKKYYDVGELIINDKNQIIITLGQNPEVPIFAFSQEPKVAPLPTENASTGAATNVPPLEFATVPARKSTAPTKQVDLNEPLDYGPDINPEDIPF